jgi:hypothetical protein
VSCGHSFDFIENGDGSGLRPLVVIGDWLPSSLGWAGITARLWRWWDRTRRGWIQGHNAPAPSNGLRLPTPRSFRLAVADPAEDFWQRGAFAVHEDADAVEA